MIKDEKVSKRKEELGPSRSILKKFALANKRVNPKNITDFE